MRISVAASKPGGETSPGLVKLVTGNAQIGRVTRQRLLPYAGLKACQVTKIFAE